ncbi:MAG: sporulation transcriptional regulator SpoIIID [Clostridia bacterium]|nr:sporulation transcriptional regulator SpoIIID [Clostridia bacterium]
MREDVRLRVMQAAEYILETGATVRSCAAKYGVSKTTIHKDMRDRLPQLDGVLFREVDAVLRKNLEERHLRGGAATRAKYRRDGEQSGDAVP